MNKIIDVNQPIEIKMSTASMNTAVEYWFRGAVFQTDITIDSVIYNSVEGAFQIKILRSSTSEDVASPA